jgi:thioester reductase-like protein
VTDFSTARGSDLRPAIYWRVEGSLLNLSAVHPVAYFTWNAQTFSERWKRRGGLFLLALVRPLLYAIDRIFATRVLHTLLRGISRDRLDLLGEEYFEYVLKPQLRSASVEMLSDLVSKGENVVLVSQGLDHVMRPLARHLGINRLIANRLEFRDGLATGRLERPVIRPRQFLARIIGRRIDGRISAEKLTARLGFAHHEEILATSAIPARETTAGMRGPLVLFDSLHAVNNLSVRRSLEGRSILLIGFTGFIGKVLLAKILKSIPEAGRVFVLIRKQRSMSAARRFEKILEESPVFDELHETHGDRFSDFISERVEVVEGDVTLPGLGIAPEIKRRLFSELDLIINSSGLTDFNPDLRLALSINIDGVANLIDFQKECREAALLHLSTCYVVGFRDGRIGEQVIADYNPQFRDDFSAETEYLNLKDIVSEIDARSLSAEITWKLSDAVRARSKKVLSNSEFEAHLNKLRSRWVRDELIEAGMRRAGELGWPNTYTLTKSLAESLLVTRGKNLPITIVRPSIVETSTADPFCGWNEGVNTSAPLSYLLGTYFRQLPSNEQKCLDIVPVDLVCRGMLLISAALIARTHEKLYQLATSAANPCNMRRSIELTGLAHRKHYRAQPDFEYRLLSMFDSIPVSKERYQKLSAPRQKAVVQALLKITAPLPMARSPLVRRERDLDRVEKLIELYEPFILHNVHVFEARNVEILSAGLADDEIREFGYDAAGIDWWDYWINVHIPALRKWSYPIIEGRPGDVRSRREVRLASSEPETQSETVGPRRRAILADETVGT